jgi:hypothetical protein
VVGLAVITILTTAGSAAASVGRTAAPRQLLRRPPRAKTGQQHHGASPDNIEATNFGAEPELARTRSRQASLVVDPPDGRRPARTPEAALRPFARSSFSPGAFDSVTDLGTYDRCIALSLVPAAQPSNTVEIVQGPGYVVIVSEVIHDARIVRLDGHAHTSPAIRGYIGDSRGRWNGRTLVVTTTNLNGQSNLTGNGGGRPTDRATVVERYTPASLDTLLYEATIDDPGTWTRPWTIAFPAHTRGAKRRTRIRLPRRQLRPFQHPERVPVR